MDYDRLKDEWESAGSPKTLIEWPQEAKLERRLTAEEMKNFTLWSLMTFTT